MPDDEHGLSLSRNVIDVVTAEVKANQPCALNGPWTDEDRQNVHRVLAAIGCVPPESIVTATADIYQDGIYHTDVGLRIRLVAVGRQQSKELADTYPDVTQLTWPSLLAFIWDRFHTYRQQKKQVDQWDAQGREIKRLADQAGDVNTFVAEALRLMGVQNDNPAG
jgi:hypothetical protein